MKKLLLSLCVLLAVTVVAQKKTDSLTIKIDALFERYTKNGSPGVAAGIVQNGQVVFKKGYGLANLEYDIPITSSSVFDIASVSKQFCGLAISMLIEEGKISLSDDIRKHLPEVPNFGKTITINHLLHHTSGLRDWPEGLNVAGWRWDEVFSFDDIIRMVKHQKELDFDPGEKHSYSNTGYNLLALLVQRISGQPFREWTDAHLFKPLHMDHSHFLDDQGTVIKNMAYSYSSNKGEFHKRMTGLTAIGSSSLFTTVDDLCLWVIHFNQQLAAKDPVYTRMLDDGILNNGKKVGYGFGLGLGEEGKLKTIDHTGGWAGYRTVIVNFPNEKLSVILLGNIGDFNSYGSALDVAKLFLKDKFQATPADKSKALPTIKLKESLAKKYEGTYQLGDGWYVTLTWENGQLMTQANGEDKFPTLAKSDSLIWIEAYGSSMTFVRGKDGMVNLLRYRDINAPRVQVVKTEVAHLERFAGTYYSEEFGTEYKIDFVNNKLALHHMRLGDFDITPDLIVADAFSCDMGTLKFYADNGKVAGFRLSRGRVKNLKFVKR